MVRSVGVVTGPDRAVGGADGSQKRTGLWGLGDSLGRYSGHSGVRPRDRVPCVSGRPESEDSGTLGSAPVSYRETEGPDSFGGHRDGVWDPVTPEGSLCPRPQF